MTNETIVPTAAKPTPNGQPQGEQTSEKLLARARRILAGGIRLADYLAVPDGIVRFVSDGETKTGVQMLPEHRMRIIGEITLQEHHAGNVVLTHHTRDGVAVLGVGADEIDYVLESLTPDKHALTRIEYPALMLEESPIWE